MNNTREKLLPAINLPKKEELKKEPQFDLNGSISVNKLLRKPKEDSYALKIAELCSVKEKLVEKRFSNQKEELHYRLNRSNKLKINEKLTNYISNTKDNSVVTKPKNIKHETDQIKDANKQIKEVTRILETKEANLKKNKSKINAFENRNAKPKRVVSDSNLKHVCTKGLKSRINTYNMIIEKFEKQLKFQEATSATLNKSTLHGVKDDFNTRIGGALSKMNTNTLGKIKKQIDNKGFMKRSHFQYKSVKDFHIDEEKIKHFENEVKSRYQMPEDPKETTVLYENQAFEKLGINEELNQRDVSSKRSNSSDTSTMDKTRINIQKEIERKMFEICKKSGRVKVHKNLGLSLPISQMCTEPKTETVGSNPQDSNGLKSTATSPRMHSADILSFSKANGPITLETITTTSRNAKVSFTNETIPSTKSTKTVKTITPRSKAKLNEMIVPEMKQHVSTNNVDTGTNSQEHASELHKSILKSDFLTKEFHLNTSHGVYPLPESSNKDLMYNLRKSYVPLQTKNWPNGLETLIL